MPTVPRLANQARKAAAGRAAPATTRSDVFRQKSGKAALSSALWRVKARVKGVSSIEVGYRDPI